jgi:restriction system protein
MTEWLEGAITYEGPAPQIGADWSGRLDEWLTVVLLGEAEKQNVQNWSFPTDQLRDEYLQTIHDRSDDDVLALLRCFLFPSCTFPSRDKVALGRLLDRLVKERRRFRPVNEYEWVLLRYLRGEGMPHAGVRWTIDLLPADPKRAIAAIEAYLAADWIHLPDGAIDGLADSMQIIRARYIADPKTNSERRLYLYELTPRQFEGLVRKLYEQLGYNASLTPPSRDGGRDIVARRQDPGRRETLLIECKLHNGNVRLQVAQRLIGVVAHENANRGVLVTSGSFTRTTRMLAAEEPRLELIDGMELVALLNEHLGAHWPTTVDRITSVDKPRSPPQ